MAAVMLCGAPHRAQPAPLVTVSQSPPAAVEASNLKLGPSPGLVIVMVCGSGFAPPNTLVKLIALTWLKILLPTTTLTGTVTLPVEDWNRSWPINVPAMSPPFGRFGTDTPIVMTDGAVPLVVETVGQFPPSEGLPAP